MRDVRIAVADIQQIFFYRGMREEEQDLGYESEFGIWIWPQLEKSPKPAAPVSKPWSWVLSSFIYSSITSLVLENQRANVGFWTVGLPHIPKKCKRDTKGCKGGCKAGMQSGVWRRSIISQLPSQPLPCCTLPASPFAFHFRTLCISLHIPLWISPFDPPSHFLGMPLPIYWSPFRMNLKYLTITMSKKALNF